MRCLDDSEEQRGWDEKAEKTQDLFILQSHESRGGRIDTYQRAAISLSLCLCVCVQNTVLSSTLFMPQPKYLLFMTSSNKFQLHLFFKLLVFSTEPGVEELIPQSEGPRVYRLNVGMSLDKSVTHPLLVCRCVRAMSTSLMSPTSLLGQTVKVSYNSDCLSG